MYNFDEMISYVKEKLTNRNALDSGIVHFPFRNRFNHTMRVYKWAKRIESDLPVDKDVLYTACIFHDIGYIDGKKDHAINSAKYFEEYAKKHNFDKEFTGKVIFAISNHSNKGLLADRTIPNELTLLLEADLLDEEGALGILWDLLAIGMKNPTSYEQGYEHLMIHSAHILNQDFMVTPLAKKYWDEKKQMVKSFLESIESDLFM